MLIAISLTLATSPLEAAQISISLFSPVYIPFPKRPVVPLFILFPISSAICSFRFEIIINNFVKYIPSKTISIIFPIKYILIAEYKPISISLKNITFNATITVSIIIIILLILKLGL